jgi:hypothetical protein
MATYLELFSLADQGGALLQRVAVACVIQANTIRTETPPPTARSDWPGRARCWPIPRARRSRCCGPRWRRTPG